MNKFVLIVALALSAVTCSNLVIADESDRPNIVLVMADDQGWGQTGYYDHPHLKTPHLDAMAAAGLRFDRFYAGAPVCSPTRATVLTGRSNDRCGVQTHGYALRLQERTISAALQQVGYATGHFGKWHLDGLRGPGAPLLAEDPYSPGVFGFDEWLSVTNFFDMNPIMSRRGEWEEFQGDSSGVTVREALKFIKRHAQAGRPSLTVVWFGSPHSPWRASPADQLDLLDDAARHHYGELVAMDRSIGALRSGLSELGVSENTIVWFNSDNGGLSGKFGPDAVGGLRGGKGTLYEGGLRVPAIVEWPAKIQPRLTRYPACTTDIAPTLVDVLGLPGDSLLPVVDGLSLAPLFAGEVGRREKLIGFHYRQGAALIGNNFKIITLKRGSGKYVLYDLEKDPAETTDVFGERPVVARRMQTALEDFIASVDRSAEGADYPTGRVTKDGPHFRFWSQTEEYRPYLEQLKRRPEYAHEIGRRQSRQ